MDSLVLNGPNGSSINIASFLLAAPGADFGDEGLIKAAFVENPPPRERCSASRPRTTAR
jgi:hypothetical protein